MTTLREAAERALDALVWESEGRLSEVVPKSTTDAITALRAALAEPEKKWVGLSEIEIVDIMDEELETQGSESFGFARAIELALKVRNTK